MNPATMEFLRQRFASYYRHARFVMPPAIEQREWGFIFFDPNPDIRMRRHMAFSTREEAGEYLRTMVPAHVYYSTAYYAMPAAPTMQEKIWAGADLIFDLDADHIVRGPYRMMLERVKVETEKLLKMLTVELGIAPDRIQLAFSGGRGYHVHVRDDAIRSWASAQRRELIDYVCGIGIDPAVMLGSGARGIPGWRQRYRHALISLLREYAVLGKDEAVERLSALEREGRSGKHIGKKTASDFYDGLDALIRQLEDPEKKADLPNPVIRALVSREDSPLLSYLKEEAALADEPVTTDIKRLIRLPGSLHGGSGFRVTPLEISDLHAFDPLEDAVVFGSAPVAIEVKIKEVAMPILGKEYHLGSGLNTVPEALAVFLCCRGLAEIAGGSDRRGA
jgi:DNA primase small subunit